MNPLPPDRASNLIIWAVVWAGFFAWAAITAASARLPSFADVLAFLRRFYPVRLMLLAFWAWLGWHLFVRTM